MAFLEFLYFQRSMSSFLRNRFSVARLSTLLVFTLLLYCACLGTRSSRLKIGKDRELTACEWEGMGML